MKTMQARGIAAVLMAVVMLVMAPVGTLAAFPDGNPVPVQEFYVPFPEDQLLEGLRAIEAGGPDAAPVNPMTTYISLAVGSSGTVIYYDQWENGYDADISNPTNIYSAGNPGGTQIWGDGDASNGAPPGIPSDVLGAGTVIVLHNSLNTNTLQSVIDFDGRDKIAATKTIALTRTGWASGSGTLMAGSVEVFDTMNWGTNYRVPVGENISGDDDIFEYTGIAVMAGAGGATISVDVNADGDFADAVDVNGVTLAEGESRLVNGGIRVGARVVSDRPVQVDLLTGDRGSNYESRDSALLPTNLWTGNYYTPVSTISSAGTKVWLYNPGTTSISVTYQRRSGGSIISANLTVPAGGYLSQVIPEGTGARFFTQSGAPFYAFSTTDSTGGQYDNMAWDWGYTLVPEDSLTPQVLIGLGIGRDPTSSSQPNENGNPVWVTPVGNGETPVTVYVDYDANPATGPLVDPNGNRYNVSYSLRELQQQKIYNPSGNQTGMLVYVLAERVKLAAAWGQDPATASVASPGLDVGTGVPPFPLFDAGKNGTMDTDVDGDGFLSPGDIVLYTITTNNISRAPVPDLRLFDELPNDVTYVPNSTFFTNAAGVTVQIPDSAAGTAFPLDGAGHILDSVSALPVGGHYTVTFKATIKDFADLTPGITELINEGEASAVFTDVPFVDRLPLYGKIGDFVWEDSNLNGIQDAGEAGIPGVLVKLRDSGGNVVATQLTDAAGGYLFIGVPAGSYTVEFVLPAGYLFSPAGQGSDPSVDSNANPATGMAAVTLPGGKTDRTIDAGMWRPNPQITVTKTANPTAVPETGGDVEFTVTVQNTGSVPVILTEVVDSVFGEIPVGLFDKTYLAVGDIATYTFTEWLESPDLTPHNNVVKATALYGKQSVEDEDDADVTFVDVLPEIAITKTANPTSVPQTGADVTFTFAIENPSNETVTVTSLHDDVFGDLLPEAVSQNGGNAIVLEPGAGYSFNITRRLSSPDLTPHTNTVTVKAKDDEGNKVSDEDDATVTFTEVRIEIDVTKTANPTAVPETGGDVEFTVVVENTGTEAVTLTGAVDSVFGTLDLSGFDKTYLEPGESATYTFTEWLTGSTAVGHNNVVTVTAEDNNGTEVEDEDDADVTFTDVLPEIVITKTANPTSVPETGADVTFSFTIQNPSAEVVTVTSLTDSVFGNLLPEAVSQNGGNAIVLDPGASYSFSITRSLSSPDLTPHANTVTVEAKDDEGNKASDEDDETVAFDDVLPQIAITKTAMPGVVPEPGGDVEFTFAIENPGTERVTVTSLGDSIFGDLLPEAVSQNGGNAIVLDPSASYTFKITRYLEAGDLSAHNNVVTVTAEDNEGNEASDEDDATVEFDDTLPQIAVTKSATPGVLPETGGYVTFTVVVQNTGTEAVTLTGAVDSVFGPLDLADFDKTYLEPGESAVLEFEEWLISSDMVPHNNVVTVTAEDNDGNQTEDEDDADVLFTDVLPEIAITKTANRTSVPEPGGDVTFTFVISNVGGEELTVTSLVDDVFGDLLADAEAENDGQSIVLAPHTNFTFSITRSLDAGELAPHVNRVDVVGADDDGNETAAYDTETVTFTDVLPSITVTKDVDIPEAIEPGGTFTYTVVVTNTSPEPLTLTRVADDKFGVIYEDESITLEPGAAETFTFQMNHTTAGRYPNTVFATAVDDEGNSVTANDNAEVVIRRVGISVVKTSDAVDGAVESGSTVTYTYVVTNTGDVTLYDVRAVDDKLGVVGTVESLAPGASVTFTASAQLDDTTTNVVVATGSDEDGNTVRDEDTVTVETFLPFTPPNDPDPDPDPYLPYTGGALASLIAFAAVSTLLGVILRKRAAA